MSQNVEAPQSVAALPRGHEAEQRHVYATISLYYTPLRPAISIVKAVLVDVLRHLFELSPGLAACLGRCITWLCPWIKEI